MSLTSTAGILNHFGYLAAPDSRYSGMNRTGGRPERPAPAESEAKVIRYVLNGSSRYCPVVPISLPRVKFIDGDYNAAA